MKITSILLLPLLVLSISALKIAPQSLPKNFLSPQATDIALVQQGPVDPPAPEQVPAETPPIEPSAPAEAIEEPIKDVEEPQQIEEPEPRGPSVIDAALGLVAPGEEPVEETYEIVEVVEQPAAPTDDPSVLKKVLRYVKTQVFGDEANNSTEANAAIATAETQAQVLPDANELGTGFSSSDFYRIAELIAPNGPGTIAYHESLQEEAVAALEQEVGQTAPIEEQEPTWTIPFTPQGRTVGQYEENETKQLERVLPKSPFAEEHFEGQEPQSAEAPAETDQLIWIPQELMTQEQPNGAPLQEELTKAPQGSLGQEPQPHEVAERTPNVAIQ